MMPGMPGGRLQGGRGGRSSNTSGRGRGRGRAGSAPQQLQQQQQQQPSSPGADRLRACASVQDVAALLRDHGEELQAGDSSFLAARLASVARSSAPSSAQERYLADSLLQQILPEVCSACVSEEVGGGGRDK